jgi:hypothetical protein
VLAITGFDPGEFRSGDRACVVVGLAVDARSGEWTSQGGKVLKT